MGMQRTFVCLRIPGTVAASDKGLQWMTISNPMHCCVIESGNKQVLWWIVRNCTVQLTDSGS